MLVPYTLFIVLVVSFACASAIFSHIGFNVSPLELMVSYLVLRDTLKSPKT